jgi:hypothetical protein
MADTDDKPEVTSGMDYLTKLMDEVEVEGNPLLNMVDTTRRQYLRKSCFVAVDYATDGLVRKGFITNVSANGVFIEASGTVPAGGDITMTFSSPNLEIPIKISGNIVRSAPQGIGVALPAENQNLRSMVESLG